MECYVFCKYSFSDAFHNCSKSSYRCISFKTLMTSGSMLYNSEKSVWAHLSVRIVVSVWNLQQSVLTFSFLLNEIFFFLAIYIAYITFSVVFLQFNNFYGKMNWSVCIVSNAFIYNPLSSAEFTSCWLMVCINISLGFCDTVLH